MKKLFYFFFRFILGIYLILYGIKGLSEMNDTKTIALRHLNLMLKYIKIYLIPSILIDKVIPNLMFLIKILNLSFIYGGFLLCFGFKMGKWILAFGFSLECFLIGSVRIHIDELDFCSSLTYISLIGSILLIKK